MKIKSIEPTPSPNTMKINLDEELPMGRSNNYKKENAHGAPEIIQQILQIDGVKGVYHVADFLAVERNAKFDWKEILSKVRLAFGEEAEPLANHENKLDEHFGEVNVFVQMFKGIPMQVKLTDGTEEKRFGLPQEYADAVVRAKEEGENVVILRKWTDFGIRYGDLNQIGEEIIEELMAAYPKERLNDLVNRAKMKQGSQSHGRKRLKLTPEFLDDQDWRKRYRLLEQMDDPTIEDIPVLEKALDDEKASIRRLATVYLGMIEDKRVLPLLYKAMKDKTVTVRRTAGDCLSDLGFTEAIEAMGDALQDESKLVRWRAAMFLYEVGDKSALPALKRAEDDPEFEVSMQIKLAIERIEGGEAAKGSVWKQMTEARKG
ncbi:conserved virulence factor C family protein [Bacillus aquiflavi]|uniref:Virulence factor n=1 Tax=Bacillus aquiflavi TaxID=2672567 RepID=A0A6B3VVJ3_9BACI|nr:conserved virulence factor C family protein [Bacillus aquiflavi]MBA4537793.1 conserved virulence factor C family protein [Bacillus aquiflavi]NEY82049.1 virulence factor [Bacillus aquiflavi]UAC50037.1 conserved virulence factor C family protein [Bacillus aquiflavi]